MIFINTTYVKNIYEFEDNLMQIGDLFILTIVFTMKK